MKKNYKSNGSFVPPNTIPPPPPPPFCDPGKVALRQTDDGRLVLKKDAHPVDVLKLFCDLPRDKEVILRAICDEPVFESEENAD